VIWPHSLIAVGDGELTRDLLYRPPIERKLSDEQSSNRLDTILADRNSFYLGPVTEFRPQCRLPHTNQVNP